MPEAHTTSTTKAGTVVLTLVYDTGMQAWMRVGDSRYALSDFAALVRCLRCVRLCRVRRVVSIG